MEGWMEEIIRNLDRIRDNSQYYKVNGTIAASNTNVNSKYKLDYFFNNEKEEFKKLEIDLSDKFQATINVNILPRSVRINNPRLTLDSHRGEKDVQDRVAFSRCRIHYDGFHFYGVLYHPYNKGETTSTVEIIAPYIPGIKPGDTVQVDFISNEVELIEENNDERNTHHPSS